MCWVVKVKNPTSALAIKIDEGFSSFVLYVENDEDCSFGVFFKAATGRPFPFVYQ